MMVLMGMGATQMSIEGEQSEWQLRGSGDQ
jgi:hypothetical protein